MKLPPMPLRAPLTGGDGRINATWARWFATMYEMAGVDGPAPQVDLEELRADVYTKNNADFLKTVEQIEESDAFTAGLVESAIVSIQSQLSELELRFDQIAIKPTQEDSDPLIERLTAEINALSCRCAQLEEKLNDQEIMTWLAR